MGFGFNLFFVLILLPLTGILLLFWILSRLKVFGMFLGIIWLAVAALVLFVTIINWITSPRDLDKEDYYGSYIINRAFFKGKQADWQYNTFRFEIKDNDSIYFYITDKETILKIYKGAIATTENYISERLIINMEQPGYHILYSNPTTYRSTWSFNLVFYSPKFNNVFFKKGKWKPID